MNLSDILIISSIITGLISIPFLVTGPLSDSIPTGKLVLSMDDSEVEGIPSMMSKTFSSEKFEKTYETAFGKFTMSISAGEIKQELSKPGKITTVIEDTEKTVWKITTQQYQFEITRTPNSITQICTTPDGELVKTMVVGEVNESFRGMNQDQVIEVCAQAEQDLQEEVEKMEQIKSESEIPSTETKRAGGIKITEINVSAEWIKLENTGDLDVNMTEWELMNGKESGSGTYTYTFGDFTLNSSRYVYVYSYNAGDITDSTCVNNETSLCWTKTGRWDGTRDIAILKDSEGKEVDRCIYLGTDVQDDDMIICD